MIMIETQKMISKKKWKEWEKKKKRKVKRMEKTEKVYEDEDRRL